MQYVIIGNGVAGTEAALAIRKHDDHGEITVLSQSRHHYYYRPRLIEYLAGQAELASFTLYQDTFYQEKRIAVRLGTPVVGLNPKGHTVTDAAGYTYEFDRLLIATGAECYVPPIKGADTPGVFTIRGVADCDQVRAAASRVKGAAVIGGGLLGLEVAYSLVQLGIKVTVVEVEDRLLPRQLDADGARLLQDMLERKGLDFILGNTVEAISEERSTINLGFKDGSHISAGIVVISTGIKGRTELARKSGLKVAKGIVVDDLLRTSGEGIYAAGDPIEHRGRLYGLWQPAREQGMVAGQNMSGQETAYTGTQPAATLKVTGIDVYSAGDINHPEGKVDVFKDERTYIKSIIKQRQLTGALVVGDAQAVTTFQKVFQGVLPVTEIVNKPQDKGGNMDKWECSACGYVYDPEKGDEVGGIAPGTAFEDLPDDWVCPVCGVGKDQFKKT